MNEVLMIAGMTLVTFSLRYTLWASDRIQLPNWLTSALSFAPAAVLTAIIVPMVIYPDKGDAQLSLTNPYLIATTAAFALTLWRKNLLLTIGVGMLIFIFLRLLLPGS